MIAKPLKENCMNMHRRSAETFGLHAPYHCIITPCVTELPERLLLSPPPHVVCVAGKSIAAYLEIYNIYTRERHEFHHKL